MHKLSSPSPSSSGATTLVDTKSVDVGSMFLMDLSVEESCEPDLSDDFDCDEDDEDIVEDDDFRELRNQHLQYQQQLQLQLQLQQQQQQHQQAAKTTTTITIKPHQTASKTIVATSRNNSSSYKQQQQQIVEADDKAGSSSLESNETDIQKPPSNAVSYLSDHEFLEQEFNDNHHNHYSTDESEDEPLSAEDNPMKLFESIQALARSLHEDAELFGSLPPKRTLESPIRSLLLT